MKKILLSLTLTSLALSLSACSETPFSPESPFSTGTAELAAKTSGDLIYQGMPASPVLTPEDAPAAGANTESYDRIVDNPFLATLKNPLSTFSIDVDTASYSNIRRFIQQGSLPPKDAVRIEEMLNYFNYAYPQPEGEHPLNIHTELSESPWKPGNQLLKIGLKGKDLDWSKAPQSNLVFLIDVSGSMADSNKLPLLQQSLKLMLENLGEKDHISIVVYAGSAGEVLPPTPANQKEKIMTALERLRAGGSTAGGEGLELAYTLAKKHFIAGGNNRVILATDGDFNVGPSSDAEMERLIEAKRKEGIFLTVLGYGMGNYKDSKMEKMANQGNGNYAYIDTLNEAKKVLVNEMGGTFFTLAKDVKLQLEFNPAKVASYRLIGYENRLLAAEDFEDDSKDAGELGAGHTVTALYELVPAAPSARSSETLTYSETEIKPEAQESNELLTLELRYKAPESDTSKLLSYKVLAQVIPWVSASKDLHFAASVAGFGMLLRDSEYKGDLNYEKVLSLGRSGLGLDPSGYRQAYLDLVSQAARLKP